MNKILYLGFPLMLKADKFFFLENYYILNNKIRLLKHKKKRLSKKNFNSNSKKHLIKIFIKKQKQVKYLC